ncbi:MAG: hypothetical protein U0270_03155 [Labilithrix sp.]
MNRLKAIGRQIIFFAAIAGVIPFAAYAFCTGVAWLIDAHVADLSATAEEVTRDLKE